MKHIIFFILALCAFTIADAGSVSRGGASFSAARSFAPARSTGYQPSYAPRSVPTPRTTTIVHAPTTTTTIIQHAPAQSSNGHPFLSSLAGSTLGSYLGSRLAQPSVPVAPVAAPTEVIGATAVGPVVTSAAPSPVIVATSTDSGFEAWLCFLVMLVFAAFLILVARKLINERASASTPQAGSEFDPLSLFHKIQDAFARKDESTLRALVHPGMAESFVRDLPEQATNAHTLKDVVATIKLEMSRFASVTFKAQDSADGTRLNETWHFVKSGGAWLLHGITAL